MSDKGETGVLIVVHGDYGAPMVDAAEAIVGPLELAVASFCFEADPDQVRRRVQSEITRLDRGSGVLVLTDLCGSTPANVCQTLVEDRGNCAVLSGLNLPMLVKLSTCDRALGPHRLAEELHGTSRRSIVVGTPAGENGGARGD